MFGGKPDWDDSDRDEELEHRGREISKLSWEQEERRKGRVLQRIPPRTGVLWSVFTVLVFLPVFVEVSSETIVSILLSYVVGFVILFIIFMAIPQPNPRVVRVYENGVLVEHFLAGRQYLPWGSFERWTLNRFSNKPDVLTVKGELYTVDITDDLDGFNRWVDDVKGSIDDPKSKQMDPESIWEGRRSAFLKRVMRDCVASFMVASSVVFFFLDTGLDPPDGYLIPTIVIIYLIVGIFIFPWFIYVLFEPNEVRKYGLNIRWLTLYAVLVVLMLHVGFVATLYVSHPGIWKSEDDASMLEEPSYNAIAPGLYTNDTVIADGPVTVRAGETLTMINCTLTFVPSRGWGIGIWVAEGGHLELRDCWVVCNDHQEGYSFEIYGSALIEDTIVQATSDRDNSGDLDSGIEIYNDSVILRSTIVRSPNELGVMVYHCSPTIENCTFETTDDYAIVVSSGNPLIADCTFIECDAAIWLWDSDANITNCTFLRNRYGIESEWGSPTIDNCTFSYTNYTAIEVDTNGAAVLGDNEFIGNGKDVVTKDMALSDLYFALIMVIMMSSTLLIMLGWELRKKWKKGRKRRKKWRLKRHDDLAGDPVTVVCPNCSTENEVTDTRRPYEFRCEVCASLLRLKG